LTEMALHRAARLDADAYLVSNVAKAALAGPVWLACVLGPAAAAAIVGGSTMYLPPPAVLLAAALVLFVVAQ